jgi:hypothetical protein
MAKTQVIIGPRALPLVTLAATLAPATPPFQECGFEGPICAFGSVVVDRPGVVAGRIPDRKLVMTRIPLWAFCVAMLAAAVSGAPIYTFSFSSSTQTFNIDSVSAFSQTGPSNWTIEKPIDSLTPKLTQSVALGTQYASAYEVEFDGSIAPDLVVGSYDFTGVIFTSITHPDALFPNKEIVMFSPTSAAFTAGPAALPEPNAGFLAMAGSGVFLALKNRRRACHRKAESLPHFSGGASTPVAHRSKIVFRLR